MTTHVRLHRALRSSVPYRMREIFDAGGPTPEQTASAEAFIRECGQTGRLKAFRHPANAIGDTPRLFNRLSAAIAVLAFLSGGITLFGDTWDIERTHLPPPDPGEHER